MAEDFSTLVALLQTRAAAGGDRLAYAFLEDGTDGGETLTYAQLDQAARRIAAALQASHAPGEKALLLFPAGLDFLKAFFGCLYAGIVAIPAPAPEATRRKRTLPRLQSIARDAGVSIVLSTGETLALIREVRREVPELGSAQIIDLREIPDNMAALWQAPALRGGDLAYLQYTSGSTTSPKGVMLSHHNVLHHCCDLRAKCGYGPDSISVTWLPYFHDYGLIEGLLVPLQNGTPCHVMSPFAFLKRPFAWLNAISTLRATHTQGPNFAYDQCVRRIRPDQLARLDLSSLRSAGNGAEQVNPAVLETFLRTFAPCGLRAEAISPAYGLAEATLMVTCCPPSQAPRIESFHAGSLGAGQAVEMASTKTQDRTRRITSCGSPLGQITIAIVDPETRRTCEAQAIGEVWIADPCVALGYWGRDAETEETFRAFTSDSHAGPFLRTGDLGFLKDGELYLTSRIKDLIIIAGTNHYPQDIEWSVEHCHPAIRPSHVAACASHEAADERLIVAVEVERGSLTSTDEVHSLLNAVRKTIAEEHEVQVHAILVLQRASLPKTASGKIQRHSLGHLLHDDSPEVIARWVQGAGLVKCVVTGTGPDAETTQGVGASS